MDAFRAANQAIGRGIRHRDDWCHYTLMDQRYKTSVNLLSSWVRAGKVEETLLDAQVSRKGFSQQSITYRRLIQNRNTSADDDA